MSTLTSDGNTHASRAGLSTACFAIASGVSCIKVTKVQYDKDLESLHKALFLEARDMLLSIDGVKETKK